MREAYKALHDLAAQLSQKTEIDLHFYPSTFEVEDTCYVVTDVFGLIAQLQKLRDLPDSFDESYDRIVEAIRPYVYLPSAFQHRSQTPGMDGAHRE